MQKLLPPVYAVLYAALCISFAFCTSEQGNKSFNHPNYSNLSPEVTPPWSRETRHSKVMDAVQSQNIDLLKYFIFCDANVNSENENGETPLMLAAKLQNLEMVKLLLDKGANKQAKSNTGQSAFDFAEMEEIKAFLNPELEDVKDLPNAEVKQRIGFHSMNSTFITPDSMHARFPPASGIAFPMSNQNLFPLLTPESLSNSNTQSVLPPPGFIILPYESESMKQKRLEIEAAEKNMALLVSEGKFEEAKEFVESGGLEQIIQSYGFLKADAEYVSKFLESLPLKSEKAPTGHLQKYIDEAFLKCMLGTRESQKKLPDLELARLFVAKGANIDGFIRGCPLLSHLVSSRKFKRDYDMTTIQFIVEECEATVDLPSNDGYTACMEAYLKQNFEVAEYLLEKGAEYNSDDKQFRKAIKYALSDDSNCELEAFLSAWESRDIYWRLEWRLSEFVATHLTRAITEENMETAYMILDRGFDINEKDVDGKTALMAAVSKTWNNYGGPPKNEKNMEFIRFLIEKGADLNAKDKSGKSVLSYAVENDFLPLVAFLIIKGANPSIHSSKYLGLLDKRRVLRNQPSIATLLKFPFVLEELGDDSLSSDESSDGDIDWTEFRQESNLFIAVQKQDIDLVKHLVSVGATIDMQDENEITPLMLAAKFQIMEIVKFLLDNGASKDARSRTGHTAFDFAQSKELKELLKVNEMPRLQPRGEISHNRMSSMPSGFSPANRNNSFLPARRNTAMPVRPSGSQNPRLGLNPQPSGIISGYPMSSNPFSFAPASGIMPPASGTVRPSSSGTVFPPARRHAAFPPSSGNTSISVRPLFSQNGSDSSSIIRPTRISEMVYIPQHFPSVEGLQPVTQPKSQSNFSREPQGLPNPFNANRFSIQSLPEEKPVKKMRTEQHEFRENDEMIQSNYFSNVSAELQSDTLPSEGSSEGEFFDDVDF